MCSCRYFVVRRSTLYVMVLYTLRCFLVLSPSVVSTTSSSTVPESTRIPKIQVYQATHVDVCQLLWGIEAPNCEIFMKMDSVNSDLVDRVSTHPLWTKLRRPKELNKSTCSQLLLSYDRKSGEILTSPTSPKTLGSSFPNAIFLVTKLRRFATQNSNYFMLGILLG